MITYISNYTKLDQLIVKRIFFVIFLLIFIQITKMISYIRTAKSAEMTLRKLVDEVDFQISSGRITHEYYLIASKMYLYTLHQYFAITYTSLAKILNKLGIYKTKHYETSL